MNIYRKTFCYFIITKNSRIFRLGDTVCTVFLTTLCKISIRIQTFVGLTSGDIRQIGHFSSSSSDLAI